LERALLPYLVSTASVLDDAIGSVVLSGSILFFIGYYEARTTVGSLWKSGFQMAAIGLASGLAGFLIGNFVGAHPS
jgi:VIT1/CCC1 family predicted Fe2+/Mn2+ transporter